MLKLSIEDEAGNDAVWLADVDEKLEVMLWFATVDEANERVWDEDILTVVEL